MAKITEGRNVRCPQCDVTYWIAEYMVQNVLDHETRCFACNSPLEIADNSLLEIADKKDDTK